MKKIPDNVKIGAHNYAIDFRDDLDDGNFGTCRPSKLRIFIDEGLPQSQKEETFFHEVMHAIYHSIGLSSPWNPGNEERDVQALGHAVYQFLNDNKLLK